VLCSLLARIMLVSPRLYGARRGRTQVLKGLYGRAMVGGRHPRLEHRETWGTPDETARFSDFDSSKLK
jgi:hypothetical protein